LKYELDIHAGGDKRKKEEGALREEEVSY